MSFPRECLIAKYWRERRDSNPRPPADSVAPIDTDASADTVVPFLPCFAYDVFMTARGQFDLVGHSLIRYEELVLDPLISVSNLVVAPEDAKDDWARTTMKMIGDWRAVLRSTYIRWAMAINGLHVAAARYRSEKEPKEFTVSGIRADQDGQGHPEIIARYSFQDAADAHLKIQPMLCAHGFIDMYAGLEEMIFALFRTYLLANPEHLIKGPEFSNLRKLRRNASSSPEAMAVWETAFTDRLNQWQRNRLYDGLDKVLLSYCQTSGLKTPIGYTKTSVETWSESIAGISLIRNLLIHGENAVPVELEAFSQKPHSLGFHFVNGEMLRLNILDLQVLENFCDQLLTALNLSLVERVQPSLRIDASVRFNSNHA